MIKASDFNSIKVKEKEEKYNLLMEIQEKFIKNNMEKGKRSVLFIFTDKEYYLNDMEKLWFEELKEKSTRKLEENGFTINGIVVEW